MNDLPVRCRLPRLIPLFLERRNPSESRNEVIPVDWQGKSRGGSVFGPRRDSHSLASFSLSSSNFCRNERFSILRCDAMHAMHACVPGQTKHLPNNRYSKCFPSNISLKLAPNTKSKRSRSGYRSPISKGHNQNCYEDQNNVSLCSTTVRQMYF